MGEDHDLKQNNRNITLFRFELNHSQSIITLIFALTGLFLVPVLLGGEIFFNLFNGLFRYLPNYLSDWGHSADLNLYYLFEPNIANIIIYSVFLYLSFITFKKILGGLGGEGTQKPNITPQDRIVRWFGLNLSQGQAIFIFGLSLMGISFLILQILGIGYPGFNIPYYDLLYIPYSTYSSRSILNVIFLILSLYSIFATRRRKESNFSEIKTTSNLGVFIFIASFFTLLFYLMRLFAHLFMFTDLAYLIGISPQPTDIDQFNDFLNVIIILIGSSAFMVSSYYLKKKAKIVQKEKENLTWFHVKLTKNRYIVLLSYTIMYSCLLSFLFAFFLFSYGSWIFYNEGILFFLIFFLLILYSFFMMRNKYAFQRILSQFNDSVDFTVKWLKFKLNRLQSVILCSLSSGAMFFYIFEILTFRASFQFELSNLDIIWIVQLISMVAFLSLLLLFALYTIKSTYKAVKFR